MRKLKTIDTKWRGNAQNKAISINETKNKNQQQQQ